MSLHIRRAAAYNFSAFASPVLEVAHMRRVIALALLLLLCSLTFAAGGHSGRSSGSHPSKTHSTRTKASNKTVHVRGHYRKDGAYVAPYERSAPGTADKSPSMSGSPATTHYYHRGYLAHGYTPHPTVQRDKHGRIKRSNAARSAFERQSPCPSTGKTSGRCPGYVVDHVVPLECGGADAAFNMQWQTTADARAKDKTEGSCRLR